MCKIIDNFEKNMKKNTIEYINENLIVKFDEINDISKSVFKRIFDFQNTDLKIKKCNYDTIYDLGKELEKKSEEELMKIYPGLEKFNVKNFIDSFNKSQNDIIKLNELMKFKDYLKDNYYELHFDSIEEMKIPNYILTFH